MFCRFGSGACRLSGSVFSIVVLLTGMLNASAYAHNESDTTPANNSSCVVDQGRSVCAAKVGSAAGAHLRVSLNGLRPHVGYAVQVAGKDGIALSGLNSVAPAQVFAGPEGDVHLNYALGNGDGAYDVQVVEMGTFAPAALIGGVSIIQEDDGLASAVLAVANPPRPTTCGLDIVLVMDSSGSVSTAQLAQMKTAFIGFVNAFLPATPTQFAVVDFDAQATVLQGFTNNIALLTTAINTPTSGGTTNWDDALYDARVLLPNRLDKADMIVFSSDGNPNRRGGHNFSGHNTAASVIEAQAMEWAVIEADAAKTAGVRIEAIGIGSGINSANLEAVSSADAVTLTDFAGLATSLANLATIQCGGTITVTKLIDADGNLGTTGDRTPANGWTFTTNVDAPDFSTPVSGMTTGAGQINFAIDHGVDLMANVDVIETVQVGYAFLSVACLKAGNTVGAPGVNAVNNISITPSSIVSCTFINKKIPVCGDGALDVGEQCDDGNTLNGDCCSSTCQYAPNGSACAADGNQCTNDVCNGLGLCEHPNSSIGTTCNADANLCTNDHCNGLGMCVFLSNVTCQAAAPPCEGGQVCNPGTGACVNQPDAPSGTSCNTDGNFCTIDQCNGSGACVFISSVTCMAANPPCEGGQTCNPGTGSCVNNPDAPAGTSCNTDNNLCTIDKCNGFGLCELVSTVSCPGSTGDCDAGTSCNPMTGGCVANPDPPSGTACEDDKNLCTIEKCDGFGNCIPFGEVPCTDPTGECDAGQGCNPLTGLCQFLDDPPSGSGCEEDGDLCTIEECDGLGNCVFVGNVFCPGSTGPCDAGSVCNSMTGACDYLPDPPGGTPCDSDGNQCTIDQCDGMGSCVFVGNVTCQAAVPPCEAGEMCNPATGMCVAQPDPPLSTPCEADGNFCTIDHCNGFGSCVFLSDVTCQSPVPPCEAGEVCIPSTGMCQALPDAPFGSSCEDDGNFCTIEICNGTGDCIFQANVICADPIPPCEAGEMCNPSTGFCEELMDAPPTTSCEFDGNLCTLDFCNGTGSCVHVDDVVCDGPIPPCEAGEMCNPSTGFCVDLIDAPTGTSCEFEGDLCTLDQCNGMGGCVNVGMVICPGSTEFCDAGTQCTPATGTCDPLPDPPLGTPCEDDASLCTQDQCNGMGSCINVGVTTCPGSTGTCDAGQQCDPLTGLCVHLPDPPLNTPCEDDGNMCTLEHCDGLGNCVVFDMVICPGPTGPCDAGTMCNPGTGACDPLPDPIAGTFCERDGDLCTNDACDGMGNCVNVDSVVCATSDGPCDAGEMCNPATGNCDSLPDPPPGTPCEADGTLCTLDHCDGLGACVNFNQVTCQLPVPPCEAGTMCNPSTGACDPLADAPLSTPCEQDGNLCTVDHCNGRGQCVLLSNVTCQPASPPCESGGACNPATGVCDTLPDAPSGTPCASDGDECTDDACDGSGVCQHPNSGNCGSCCLAGGQCVNDILPATCMAQGGTHAGAGTACMGDSDGDGIDDRCDQCPGVDDAVFAPGCIGKIPTVSQWGLLVLALLLMVVAKVSFGRRTLPN